MNVMFCCWRLNVISDEELYRENGRRREILFQIQKIQISSFGREIEKLKKATFNVNILFLE